MLENYTDVCQLMDVMFNADKELLKKHLLYLSIALQDYQFETLLKLVNSN